MPSADWYFDFISPFAYLASERLGALGPALRIRYRPVLFAGLLDANGQKGPAEIAAKRVFTYRFVVWQAGKLGIPIKFPHEHPFNPLPLLRLAIACESAPEAVHRIFRFVWRDGRLPDLPIEWAELAHDLGMPDADARIQRPEVKDALRRNTEEALARGLFGVPTLAIGDALFWGADAIDMARDYVAAGCRFADAEYERVSTLPEGVQRKASKTDKPDVSRKPKTRIVGTAR
jgi:2-hydroxychromene-2-carboxylate isomerase